MLINFLMGENLPKIIYISIVALIYQAVANTQLGIVGQFSSQNGNKWAGLVSAGLLFLGSGIGAMYNKYIRSGNYKLILFIGSFGYTIYIGMTIFFLEVGFSPVTLTIILLFSFLGGVLCSAFYNGQFNYINNYGVKDNCTTKYFGISFGIIQSANILGNLISAFLIKPLGQLYYSVTMACIIFVTSLFFLGVKNIQPVDGKDKEAESIISDNDNVPEDGLIREDQGQVEVQKKFPWIMVFPFALTGIMISFIYTQISVVFFRTFPEKSDEQLNQITFIVYIIEGVGQFLGGMFIVFFEKRIKSLAEVTMMMGNMFLVALAIIYLGSVLQSIPVLTIGCFLAGNSFCIGTALSLSMAGIWNQKGISVYCFGQCLAVAITSFVMSISPFEIIICITIIFQILSALALFKQRNNLTKLDSQKRT